MNDVRQAILAEVEQQIAALDEVDAAVADGLARRRGCSGASLVYSLRLEAGEITALERRAAALGIRPSVLARNLLRLGLRRSDDQIAVGEVIDRLEGAVEVLRTVRPAGERVEVSGCR